MKRAAARSRIAPRGVVAVEFALLLLPLVLMVFGTVELGRAIYTFNTLDKTVRDAARHLSQNGPGDSAVQAEARCLAVYGNTNCTGSAVAPGLTTAAIVVCDAVSADAVACPSPHASQPTGFGTVNLVSVTVRGYAFTSMVGFVIPSMTFNDISVTMRAQL